MGHYSPWQTVSEMSDVTIVFAELDDDLGFWDPDTHTITLDPRQSRRELRCTLAHEVEHVRRGDECIDRLSPVLAARQEIAASNMAARRLIPLEALISALLWSQDERELAEELNVDEDTVRMRLMTLTPWEHAVVDKCIWEAESNVA